jgi:outer membrane cobalamin receptor
MSLSYSLYADEAPVDLDLERELQNLQDMKQWIEVVSKKKESKTSAAGIVSVISHEEIARFGGNNLFDVLNRVPSLQMLSSHFYTNGKAAMRGDLLSHVNNHTLILINGRPFRDGLQGGLSNTAFRDFPIHHIQQIEIIRGAGSVLYGTNAYSGVINIVTKKQQNNGAVVRGRYGSFNTGQAESEFAWKNDEASITGAVRYHTTDGWQFSAVGEDKKASQFRMNDEDFSGSFTGDYKGFSVNAFAVHNQYSNWGPVASGSGQPYLNDRFFFDVGYKTEWTPYWLTQWNLTYNRTQSRFLLLSDTANLSTLYNALENSLLFEQSHFFKFFEDRLNITLGGLIEWQNGRAKQANLAQQPIPSYNHLKTSVYGEINYNVLDNLKLTLGGQWNRFEHLEKSVNVLATDQPSGGLIGRLGLVYEITPELGVKLLYSQAFRSASTLELETNTKTLLGYRNLQPEQVETLDAQVFYHSKNYQVSLTAFRSRQSDLIKRVLYKLPAFQYANSGSAVFQGLELETQADLFTNLHWKGSYTFQTNRDGDGHNNVTLSPNHSIKVGLSYDVTKSLQLSVFDTFMSAAKVVPSAQVVNPVASSYHNISLNSVVKLDELLGISDTKHITFSMYVDNLLSEKIYYPEFNRKVINTIPAAPGRTVFGELAIEF